VTLYPEDFELAFAPPARIRRKQEKLLREHFARCLHSRFHRSHCGAATLRELAREATLELLAGLPFMDKAAIEKFNDWLPAVVQTDFRDIVLSSGTTGKPTRIAYTARDIGRLAYNEAVCFKGCGMKPGDRVLLTCTLDRCFIAGYAYLLGAQAVGAAGIRSGVNTPEGHAAVMAQTQPTFIVGVPGFLRKLGRHLHAAGQPPSGVRGLVCIGEPLRDARLKPTALCEELERLWSAPAFSTYSSSEIVTSFCECEARAGGHCAPDLGIVEIVNDAGEILPDGEIGEVVVTPLGVEGMPLIRFRTGDLGYLIRDTCPCGRNTPRLSPILGRKAQMLKIKGTTFYPATVFEILNGIPEITEYCLEAETEDGVDRVRVRISVADGSADREAWAARIGNALQARLRTRLELVLETERELRERVYTSASRKPVRFVDKRMPSP
jgi:phenylacetate-CoA ligase